jgi:protein-arginine kinase activator protein McsA
MKCAYCDTVADNMPTVLEFLEIDAKKQTDLGVCEECQKLPRSELVKKAHETTQRRIAEVAEAILKSRRSN